MRRTLSALAALTVTAGTTLGQGYYGPQPGAGSYAPAAVGSIPAAGAMPNFYNRQYQPLSPYLNLLRGGNPGVNYYYGVRPAQMANGLYPGGAAFGAAARPAYQGGFPGALNTVPPGEAPPPADPNGNVAYIPPIGAATHGTGLARFGGAYPGQGAAGGALRGGPQNLAPYQPPRPPAPKR